MSCVVGIVEKSEIILCADSIAFDDDGAAEVRRDPKVFETKPFVIGCVESPRMAQLLRYSLTMARPKRGQYPFEFMATTFVDAVRRCFRDGGFARKENESERGGCFLVGFAGRLFRVDDDFGLAESAQSFDAIGAGGPAALSALHAQEAVLLNARRAKRPMQYAARDRALDALGAAERTTNTVRRPFICVALARKPAPAKS